MNIFERLFFNFQPGLTQQQGIDEINSTFNDEAPSRTTVSRWFADLNCGLSSFKDEFCEGHPKSVVVPENIDAVHELILQDCHVTYHEIEMVEDLYDEDLTENVFFQELKNEYKHHIDQATSDDWIICIPKAGSFESSCLAEEDFLCHILIPKEGHTGVHYQTLSRKEVKVCDKVITVDDGDVTPSLSTRILFEETFYTENLLKYKVWCIECLLNQSCIKSKFKKSSFISVTTLRECIDFLWTESLGKEILEQLDLVINNFIVKNTQLYKFSFPMQRELVNTLYTKCLQIALADKKLCESITKNKNVLNNINISVEAYMQHNIYKILFNSISIHTACDDSSFNKIVRNLSDIQLRDLDIMQDVYDAIPYSKRQLAKINGYSTALGKIGCLRHAISEISQCSSKSHSMLSVDELLPVVVFIIIKTCVPNWIANLCFLKQFQFNCLSTGDESNFLITTLEAAIEYIRSGILLVPSEPDSCQLGTTHSETDNRKKCDLYKNTLSYLFEHVRTGNYDEVKSILEKNKTSKNDVETKSKELCHPLCSCDKCEKLLSHILCSTTPTVYSSDDKGCTALHTACMYGKPKIVELLLEFGADMQKCDYSGASALHYAAMRGHQNALLLLLHSGAEMNATDNEKNTPLHYCCNNGHDACVKAILYFAEHQAKDLSINYANIAGDTALHHAAKWGYKSIVYILLEYGADPNLENNLKKTPCDYAHNQNIYQIITQTKCTFKESDNETSILSIENNESSLDLDFVEDSVLEETATKPCSPQQMKKAELLLRAVAYDDFPMICYYLGLQIAGNLVANKIEPSELCHPLCSCEKCELSEDDFAINFKDKQDINICNSEGYTALHVASLHGQREIVQLLLNNGALQNVVTNKGLTALHLACQTQRLDIVKLLLQFEGCKVNLQDIKGNTPLHYACYSRDASIIQELIEHKANVLIKNLNGKAPIDEIDEKKILDLKKTNEK